MDQTSILLKAYYETLYNLLTDNKESLTVNIDDFLREEMLRFFPQDSEEEKYLAYRQACLGFLEERLEMYNPVGIQYIYSRQQLIHAAKLQFELEWYEHRTEFDKLVETAKKLTHFEALYMDTHKQARHLIQQCGAFPDRSIISAYRDEPQPAYMPDYILALAIEKFIETTLSCD